MDSPRRIGIIGGTGPEGIGLAVRWSLAGEEVAIGSRTIERAEAAAEAVRAAVPNARIRGGTNVQVAADATVAVIALPLGALDAALAEIRDLLAGKTVISVVAAIEFVEGKPVPVDVPAGSVAQHIAHLLPDSAVAGAFHTLSAEKLGDASVALDEDTIVCADEAETRSYVRALAERIAGLRAISGGRLSNSYYPEQMVGLLATLNRIHKAHAGVKFVGLK